MRLRVGFLVLKEHTTLHRNIEILNEFHATTFNVAGSDLVVLLLLRCVDDGIIVDVRGEHIVAGERATPTRFRILFCGSVLREKSSCSPRWIPSSILFEFDWVSTKR